MIEKTEESVTNYDKKQKTKHTRKPEKKENLRLIIKKNENGILTCHQRKKGNKQKLIQIGDTTIKESVIRKCIINGLKETPILVVPCIIEKSACVDN